MNLLLFKENIDTQFPNEIEQEQVQTKVATKRKKSTSKKFWQKTHKWLGLIMSLFVLNFAISGIILNHREIFVGLDLPRWTLPGEYSYHNWNNAAIKGILPGENSNIVYGNVGVWKENSGKFTDMNTGFPSGMDNKNVQSMLKSEKGNLYAGTFNAFYYQSGNHWKQLILPTDEQRVIKILEKDSKILLLTRSEIVFFNDNPANPKFSVKQIKPEKGYIAQTGLFQTLWQLHSGEAFWMIGRLFVDFLAITFILLIFTGLIKWYLPKTFKKLKAKKEKLANRKKINLWSLSLHNQFGLWTALFLFLTTITGMFLRPPLLILVGANKVPQLPGTNLKQDNAWFDKLRNITYLPDEHRYVFATDEYLFSVDENFQENPEIYNYQPTISVMGTNVLETRHDGGVLVGSFSGLFLWYPKENLIFDYVNKTEYVPQMALTGPPIGANAVSGFGVLADGREYYFDYSTGSYPLNSDYFFPRMSEEILQKSGISLWNTALEFHTARIFRSLIGDFYILIIPLSGILIALSILAGFIYWFQAYKGKKLLR
ncbi:MAG: hypothetical protein A2X64_03070 [Ignavibacteria bacterium GWF2_33_9]|nr:MAG: hypothetical protein A2X64_03070 [Ignavibacteria bacterium GWF2_33_9]